MSDEVFAAARVFGRDIERPDGLQTNSIFEPTLYHTYLADLATGPLGD